VLVNRHGYRYLQDYGMGPETPIGQPVFKTMELGPRDRLSQAFWHEQKKGNTVETAWGDCILMDMRHLGEKRINERLPLVRELATSYVGVDPVTDPVPVRPVVHYMMGGVDTNIDGETSMAGLYAIGETACGSLNGANRLGSNSLTELLVFGKRAALRAADYAAGPAARQASETAQQQADDAIRAVRELLQRGTGSESLAGVRREMMTTLEEGAGIYRDAAGLETTCQTIAQLHERFEHIEVHDKSNVFNTDLQQALELKNMLDVAETVGASALARQESRGAHQRLDFPGRDDKHYLQHSRAIWRPGERPEVRWLDVTITRSQPGVRNYSGDKQP
jgi:fumarate reductase flavoprotein subunit